MDSPAEIQMTFNQVARLAIEIYVGDNPNDIDRIDDMEEAMDRLGKNSVISKADLELIVEALEDVSRGLGTEGVLEGVEVGRFFDALSWARDMLATPTGEDRIFVTWDSGLREEFEDVEAFLDSLRGTIYYLVKRLERGEQVFIYSEDEAFNESTWVGIARWEAAPKTQGGN